MIRRQPRSTLTDTLVPYTTLCRSEVSLIPVEGLTLGGTFAYTDATFDRTTPDPVANPCDPTSVAIVGFCSDNRFNSVPKTQYTLNLDYVLPLDDKIGKISFGGRLYHQSSVALTDTSALNPNAIETAYTKTDFSPHRTEQRG